MDVCVCVRAFLETPAPVPVCVIWFALRSFLCPTRCMFLFIHFALCLTLLAL